VDDAALVQLVEVGDGLAVRNKLIDIDYVF
jgi:hypothetical protein